MNPAMHLPLSPALIAGSPTGSSPTSTQLCLESTSSQDVNHFLAVLRRPLCLAAFGSLGSQMLQGSAGHPFCQSSSPCPFASHSMVRICHKSPFNLCSLLSAWRNYWVRISQPGRHKARSGISVSQWGRCSGPWASVIGPDGDAYPEKPRD